MAHSVSNCDALKAATVSGAELIGVAESIGRVAEGFEADLILVPAHPSEHIEALYDVLMVMRNGQIAVQRLPFGLAGDRPNGPKPGLASGPSSR